jgi:hypothetical protein
MASAAVPTYVAKPFTDPDDVLFEDLFEVYDEKKHKKCKQHPTIVDAVLSLDKGFQPGETSFDIVVEKIYTMIDRMIPRKGGITPGNVDDINHFFNGIYSGDRVITIASQESVGVKYPNTQAFKYLNDIEKRLKRLCAPVTIIEVYVNKQNSKKCWHYFNILIVPTKHKNEVYLYADKYILQTTDTKDRRWPECMTYDLQTPSQEGETVLAHDPLKTYYMMLRKVYMSASIKYIKYFTRSFLSQYVRIHELNIFESEEEYIADGDMVLRSGYCGINRPMISVGILFYGNFYGSNTVKEIVIDAYCFSNKYMATNINDDYITYGVIEVITDTEESALFQFKEEWMETYYVDKLIQYSAADIDSLMSGELKIRNAENVAKCKAFIQKLREMDGASFVSFIDAGDSYSNIPIHSHDASSGHEFTYDYDVPEYVYVDEDAKKDYTVAIDGEHIGILLCHDTNGTKLLYRGRTIYSYDEENNQLKCIKFLKKKERMSVFVDEVDMICDMGKKGLIPHLPPDQDPHIYKEPLADFTMAVMGRLNKEIEKSNYAYELDFNDDNLYYIVYYISHDKYDARDFIIYAENMSIDTNSPSEIGDVFLRNIHQAGILINNGYMHASLTALFHNTGDERRFITSSDVVRIAPGRYGVGRLDSIFQNCKFSNMRKIGISDFAEIISLKEFAKCCEGVYMSRAGLYSTAPNKMFYVRIEAICSQFFSWINGIIYNEFITNKNPTKTINDKKWMMHLIDQGFDIYMRAIHGDGYNRDIDDIIRALLTTEKIKQIVEEMEYFFSQRYIDDVITSSEFEVYGDVDTVHNYLFAEKCVKKKLQTSYISVHENKRCASEIVPRGWKVMVFTRGERYNDHHHIGWQYYYPDMSDAKYRSVYEEIMKENKMMVIETMRDDLVSGVVDHLIKFKDKNAKIKLYDQVVVLVNELIDTRYEDGNLPLYDEEVRHGICVADMDGISHDDVFETIQLEAVYLIRRIYSINDVYHEYRKIVTYSAKSDMSNIVLARDIKKSLGIDVTIVDAEKNITLVDVSKVKISHDVMELKEYFTERFYPYMDAGAVNGAFTLITLINIMQRLFMNVENMITLKCTDRTINDLMVNAISNVVRIGYYFNTDEGTKHRNSITDKVMHMTDRIMFELEHDIMKRAMFLIRLLMTYREHNVSFYRANALTPNIPHNIRNYHCRDDSGKYIIRWKFRGIMNIGVSTMLINLAISIHSELQTIGEKTPEVDAYIALLAKYLKGMRVDLRESKKWTNESIEKLQEKSNVKFVSCEGIDIFEIPYDKIIEVINRAIEDDKTEDDKTEDESEA